MRIETIKSYCIMLWMALSPVIPDKLYLYILFYLKMGYWINWKSPKTFNEKLQWLKLYDRNPIYTTLVDKYEVKAYVSDIIGQEYIIPTLGIWEHPEDINWSQLPEQFVLKTTHGGGGCGVIICKDKHLLNTSEVIKKLNSALRQNIFQSYREWPYKNVKKRIIAEPYLTDIDSKDDESTITSHIDELKDYKFFCFGGEPLFFKIDFNRFGEGGHHANYYSIDATPLHFEENICPSMHNAPIAMPTKLTEMIQLAKILSKGTKFMRCDFYEVSGAVLFGEITFFPAGGMGEFNPKNTDKILGELINL